MQFTSLPNPYHFVFVFPYASFRPRGVYQYIFSLFLAPFLYPFTAFSDYYTHIFKRQFRILDWKTVQSQVKYMMITIAHSAAVKMVLV